MEEIGRAIRDSADELAKTVVSRWRDIGAAEEWLSLPPDLGFDHLPGVIRALAAATLISEFGAEECRELAEAAARHGSDRADEGFGESLVFREHHLLRRTLRSHLRERFGENTQTFYATMRIDSGISLASTASLLGIHRSELQAQGRWPASLEDALKDWRGG